MAGDGQTAELTQHVTNYIPQSFMLFGGSWGRGDEESYAVDEVLAIEHTLKNIRIIALHGPAGFGATFFVCRIAWGIQRRDFNDAGGCLWLRGSTPTPMDPLDAMASLIAQFSIGARLPTLKADIEEAYDQLSSLLPRRGDVVVITTSKESLGLENDENGLEIGALYSKRVDAMAPLEATATLAGNIPSTIAEGSLPRLTITNPDFAGQHVVEEEAIDPSVLQERAAAVEASNKAHVLLCTELAARCAYSPLVLHSVINLLRSFNDLSPKQLIDNHLPESGQEDGEASEVGIAIADRTHRTLEIILDLVMARISQVAKNLIAILFNLYLDGIFCYNNIFSILHDDATHDQASAAAGMLDELYQCGLVWFSTATYFYAFHPNILASLTRRVKEMSIADDMIEYAIMKQSSFVEPTLKQASTMHRVSGDMQKEAIITIQKNLADIDSAFTRWDYGMHRILKVSFELLAKAVSPITLIRRYEPHLEVANKKLDMGSTLVFDAISHAYCAIVKVDEAEDMLRKSLEIGTKILGPFNLLIAMSVNAVARPLIRAGRFHEAYPLYEQALRIRVDKLGDIHAEVASSLNDLGSVYLRDDQWSDAATLFRGGTGYMHQDC